MEDLRGFLDEIGGEDRVWAVQFGDGADWLPVTACALSVPLTAEPNRRVLFYIDAGRNGRGHAFRLADFVKAHTTVHGITLTRGGSRDVRCILRGSDRNEWSPNLSQWLVEEKVERQDHLVGPGN